MKIWAATRKGLFAIERGAKGWAIAGAHFVGDHANMVLPDERDGRVYVALHHGHFGGKFHRSEDGGKTWREIAVPAYPPKPEGLVEKEPAGQTEIPWALKMTWALEMAGDPDSSGGLWCGTIPGGLFRSADGGESWTLVRPLWDHPARKSWFGGGADLPGIHSVEVDPRDPRRVFAGISCGGVMYTADGGETWEPRATGMRAEYMPADQQFNPLIQDPHLIRMCAASPDVIWCQHHNGIFRSVDHGQEWKEIHTAQPSRFGFAVAAHPKDPKTAWFVPAVKDEKRYPVDAKLVVSRTRDGGESFEVLRKGLPQEHAYDLVYRHGLDVDDEGRTLCFGSTTGSLFVSEDGGDSWQCIGSNLPPVYCVRFGG